MTKRTTAAILVPLFTSLCASALGETGRENPRGAFDSCSIILITPEGESPIDNRIARIQQRIQTQGKHPFLLERLGWLYVSKGRMSGDAGYYRLAQASADCWATERPDDPRALLLRGHVLHSLHLFAEAEEVALQLISQNEGLPGGWGLLGDARVEQGRVADAVTAYQRMIDLGPNLQSLSRGAHMRWLSGDTEGALELMESAARAGSPREPDAAAWAYAKLAEYAFQQQKPDVAAHSLQIALSLEKDYSFAHLIQARIALAEEDWETAATKARAAAEATPLPEYQWVLIEALAAAGLDEEKEAAVAALQRSGARDDPRTYALYLASRNSSKEDQKEALELAYQELDVRQDIFTHDTVAWALHANGKWEEAKTHIAKALGEGTRDARLFYHAGVIAAACGDEEEALRWFKKADALKHLLLPSEKNEFLAAQSRIEFPTSRSAKSEQ